MFRLTDCPRSFDQKASQIPVTATHRTSRWKRERLQWTSVVEFTWDLWVHCPGETGDLSATNKNLRCSPLPRRDRAAGATRSTGLFIWFPSLLQEGKRYSIILIQNDPWSKNWSQNKREKITETYFSHFLVYWHFTSVYFINIDRAQW